ncbi:Olfactory receptor 11H12, partial [Oryzias melastigma]
MSFDRRKPEQKIEVVDMAKGVAVEEETLQEVATADQSRMKMDVWYVDREIIGAAVYPKLLVDILSKRQIITYYACLLQYVVYYSLGASEFLLLTAMSFDR